MCSQQTAGETPAKQQRRLVGGPALFPTKRTAAEEHVDPPGRGSAGRPALGVRASQPVLHPSAAAGTRPRRGALRSVLLLLLPPLYDHDSLTPFPPLPFIPFLLRLLLFCFPFLFFFVFSMLLFSFFLAKSSESCPLFFKCSQGEGTPPRLFVLTIAC